MTKRWGPPAWIFIHTFSTHINPIFYEKYRNEICDLIREFFNCLPCPECTKHASHHCRNLTGDKVKTKEDFVKFFVDMHNIVNKRLRKSEFNDIQMYKRANFYKICNVFYNEMLKPTGSISFLDSSKRRVVIYKFMHFMKIHYSQFSPVYVN
jgi:hypothetical protein